MDWKENLEKRKNEALGNPIRMQKVKGKIEILEVDKKSERKKRNLKLTEKEKRTFGKLLEIVGNYYALFGYMLTLVVFGLVASIRIYEFFEPKWLSASVIGAIWGVLISEIPRSFADFYESLGFVKKWEDLKPSKRLLIRFLVMFFILIIILYI